MYNQMIEKTATDIGEFTFGDRFNKCSALEFIADECMLMHEEDIGACEE